MAQYQIPPVNEGAGRAGKGPVAVARQSAEFVRLRRRVNGFTLVVSLAVAAWFVLLLWAAGYQREFLARQVVGDVTIGMLLAWSQVLTTIAVGIVFARRSRVTDEVARAVRARVEGDGS